MRVAGFPELLEYEVDRIAFALDAQFIERVDDKRSRVAEQPTRIWLPVNKLPRRAVGVPWLIAEPTEKLGLTHAGLAEDNNRLSTADQGRLLAEYAAILSFMPQSAGKDRMKSSMLVGVP